MSSVFTQKTPLMTPLWSRRDLQADDLPFQQGKTFSSCQDNKKGKREWGWRDGFAYHSQNTPGQPHVFPSPPPVAHPGCWKPVTRVVAVLCSGWMRNRTGDRFV